MKKTMPFYPLQRLALSCSLIIFIALSGCSTPPKHPEKGLKVPASKSAEYVELLKSTPPPQLKAEDLETLSDIELELQTAKAQQQAEWPNFILLNHQLWQTASDSGQAQIEQRIWDAISQQPLAEIKKTIQILKKNPNTSVQQWGELLAILKGSAEDLHKKLKRLNESNSDAIYMSHLLPGFTMQNIYVPPPKQIAVLLPFEGKYEQVANQIKTGMMKAFMASDQRVLLRFYDASALDEIEQVYQKAKLEGADFVIGPLRKEAIERLLTTADENVLALNHIGYAPFTQFSYKSADEVTQLIRHFKANHYQNIGILSSDSKANSKIAHAIQNAWLQTEGHSAVLSTYPNHKPKLRQALGDLINEKASTERYNTLRWATGHKLKFFPRPRQDFDAIVIIDSNARMAVFKPQFAFFELNTPIYGTSQLSPKKLQKIKVNRDLAGVKFLAHPVAFQPKDLNSNFEAFGWDSFQVATQLHNLRFGGYLAQGKTGELTLKDQQIKQNLIWATYDKKGRLVPLIE
ncbi:LppC putative lipoprotein [hydrothermal vent metagenome]|uniref:LppC putative lipoprotein n=1 Tax=hydrothermal vent metagenome TaxID=652676 RepID=A0A3B0W1I9_9ZZZZ